MSCSVVRRVALPDAFFAVDGLFETFLTVLDDFGAYPAVIERELDRYLPFLSTTKVLMAAVRARGRPGAGPRGDQGARGGRRAAPCASRAAEGNDLLDRLAADPRLGLDRRRPGRGRWPTRLASSAPRRGQVAAFVAEVDAPRRRRPRRRRLPPGRHPLSPTGTARVDAEAVRRRDDRRLPTSTRGKVRDIYDAGDDRLLMVTSDRLSAFDVVHGRADPRQGPGADRHVGVLVRAVRRRRRQPPLSTDLARRPARGRRRPRAGGPGHAVPARPRCCRSSASSAATSPARRGRSTSRNGTMHGEAAARRAARVVDSCPSRCSPRRPRPTSGHDENISFEAAVDADRRRAGRAGPRRLASRSTAGARSGPPSGASSSPTPSSSSA